MFIWSLKHNIEVIWPLQSTNRQLFFCEPLLSWQAEVLPSCGASKLLLWSGKFLAVKMIKMNHIETKPNRCEELHNMTITVRLIRHSRLVQVGPFMDPLRSIHGPTWTKLMTIHQSSFTEVESSKACKWAESFLVAKDHSVDSFETHLSLRHDENAGSQPRFSVVEDTMNRKDSAAICK